MPRLEDMDRPQSAILWPKAGNDKEGQVAVFQPISLDPQEGTGVRWIDKRDEALNSKSAIVGWDAMVRVDRKIEVGSIMKKGCLEAILEPDGTVPDAPGDLYEVKAYYETPDIKARSFVHDVALMRFRDHLPLVVDNEQQCQYAGWSR